MTLQTLPSLIGRIAAGELTESEVYRQERLYLSRSAGVGRTEGVLCCPICSIRALRFAPFGLSGRRNARCPNCGSLERHRLLWLYLTRHTRLPQRRLRVLHTAPEPCLETRLRRVPRWRYRTVDRFSPLADRHADLTDLPFPAGDVDLILSSHVLEHIPDDTTAMAELARVLRPGGVALVMVPFDPKRPVTAEGRTIASPAERLARFGHPYHYRIYGADLVDRLETAGFAVRVVDSRRLLQPHQRRRYRINRNHVLHCVRRP